MKKFLKGIASLLLIAMLASLLFACGEGKSDDKGTEAETQSTAGDTEKVTDPPETTEPPTTTEKTTPEPTEAPTDPAELPEPDENGVIAGARYYLESPNSNLFLSVDGDYKYANLTQEEYTEGSPDLMFVFTRLENGNYLIHPCGTKASYLDVEEADPADGKRIEATDVPNGELEDGTTSQEWTLKVRTDGAISILSVVSKSKSCIDVNGVSKDPGAYVHQWSGGTSKNQKWFFHLVKDYVAPEPTEPAA